MPDATVVAESAFPLGKGQRLGEVDFDRCVEQWEAYNTTEPHLRQALFGYMARQGVPLPERVTVKSYRRKVRAEHRTFDIGVVIVREA